jgi:sugar lactone lactonase YvrE
MQEGEGTRGSSPQRMAAIAAVLGAAVALLGATVAGAAPGDLTYQGCLSAETESGPAGTNACVTLPVNTSIGLNSGFDNVRSAAVSPDGISLYVAASNDSAVARFDRDPASGALTYQGCFTGETESGSAGSGACTQIASAQSNGNNSGLGGPQAIEVSPDGASVYVAAANDDAVARFDRDTTTGALTYQGCITGETESGPGTGTGACTEIGSATASGTNSGLDDPQSLAVSDTSVYASSRNDDAIARFSRAAGGAISYQDCQSADSATGPTPGSGACTLISGASTTGTNSGLDFLQSIAMSPDGASLYTASQLDSAVGRFNLDANGVLAYQGCITGEAGTIECTEIASAQPAGSNSGMSSIYAVAVSPDGGSLYATSENDDAVTRFDRAAGGALTYQGCITGATESGPGGTNACAQIPSAASNGTNSGLDKLRALALSPDGGSIYVAVPQDDAVARFARDLATGAITYVGCITGETQTGAGGTNACAQIASAQSNGTNSGLDNPQAAATSSDGRSLYIGAANDAGIARFDVEQPPQPEPAAGDTDPPETTIEKGPKKKTKERKAKFRFASDEPGSTFLCKLDKKNFAPCDASEKFRVKRKKHKILVAAIDPAGNTDPTPAKRKWRVKKKK